MTILFSCSAVWGQSLQQPPGVAEAPSAEAAEAEETDKDVLDMDLDQLMETNVGSSSLGDSVLDDVVSTVSRSDVSVRETPSAVYVVTQEMIKRSGARNMMEVLRTVPGVHVARQDATNWAISIRGFNSVYADKLLVQIDGRAIYTPLFSGVIWNQQLIPLHDIERIEVIRGPGGTVWGANAVNGVINIVTKSTGDTVGAYAEAGGGNEHRAFGHGRVGGALGPNATYRVYGAYTDDDYGYSGGAPPSDLRRGSLSGFRIDWTPSDCDLFTVQGDFLDSVNRSVDQSDVSAGNLLTRWTRRMDDDSELRFQFYYDHWRAFNGPTSPTQYDLGSNVFDIDTQYHVVRDTHDIVLGAAYREYKNYVNTVPGQLFSFSPPSDRFDIISYFVQDTVTLSEDFLFLTLGCKFEHNDFVGFVYQPAVKLACTPDERTSLWASVSRSIRTPSVSNRDFNTTIPLGGGTFLEYVGNRGLQEEQAMTYEIGLRRQPTDDFYWELALFFTRYDDLIRGSIFDTTPPVFTESFFNLETANTYGGEWWATYELAPHTRLRGSYSLFFEDLKFGNASTVDSVNNQGSYPRNMAYLATSLDLTQRSMLDVGFRYVDSLTIGDAQANIPSYLTMDIRLAWAYENGVEVAIVGQHLLDSHHPEFADPTGFSSSSEIQRSVYGMVSWEY